MASYVVTHEKAKCFYDRYERKGEAQHQTHYCPGCGHGIVQKLIARAIDELGIQDRTILVTPVGCSVFAYYYFDVGNIQAAHGRASAVATAAKRSRPDSVVLCYQGDGDLAAIGTAEIVHAANRGEPITVVFMNNAIYGMTGGQMAPTTPLGQKSTTTPFGRNLWNDGYPVRMSELLAALEAPVYIERVALGNNKQIMAAGKALRRAIENQVRGLGFSMIEVLSPCPTIWKLDPVEAQRRVLNEMSATFPLGVYRDHTKEAPSRPAPPATPPPEEILRILGLSNGAAPAPAPAPVRNLSTCVSRSRALAARGCCFWANCWRRPAWMPASRCPGFPPTDRRCVRARPTATYASQLRLSIRRWSRCPTSCWRSTSLRCANSLARCSPGGGCCTTEPGYRPTALAPMSGR